MRLLSHFGQRVLEVIPTPVLTPSKLPQSKVERELAGRFYKPKRHNQILKKLSK
jgi:hypothetical protein